MLWYIGDHISNPLGCSAPDLLLVLDQLEAHALDSCPWPQRAVLARLDLVRSLLRTVREQWDVGACFERHLMQTGEAGEVYRQEWIRVVVRAVGVAAKAGDAKDWGAVGGALEVVEQQVSW